MSSFWQTTRRPSNEDQAPTSRRHKLTKAAASYSKQLEQMEMESQKLKDKLQKTEPPPQAFGRGEEARREGRIVFFTHEPCKQEHQGSAGCKAQGGICQIALR